MHDVPGALAGAIRMPRPQHHGDDGGRGRQRIEEADLERGQAELLDDLRRPDAERVEAGRGAEIDQRQRQHARIGEPAPDAVARGRGLAGGLFVHGLDQPAALVVRKPFRLLRAIGQEGQHDEAEQHGRHCLQHEQPLPALEAEQAVHLQQRAGDRRAQHGREWCCRHEQCGHRGALACREPVGEIEDDAGKEAGLRDAEQEAQDVEAGRTLHERHRRRDQAPGDHHPRDPDPRADLVQDDVGGHLEQKVAPEEDAGAKTVDGRRQADVLVHRQRGEADIDAVDEGHEVEQHDEGNDAPGDLAQHARLNLARHSGLPTVPVLQVPALVVWQRA